MDELLKKLIEADILTEDTKADLESAFQSQLSEAVERVEVETKERVQAELAEQWVTQRDHLIEAVDTKVTDFLTQEIEELKEDIERFRDLEAEHAEKLVEAKEEMATSLQSDMEQLVEKLNTFLEIRLTQEMDELKDDLQEAKKLEFGREIFEGVVNEYRKNFVNDEGIEAELIESRKRAQDLEEQLTEAATHIEQSERTATLDSLLKPLAGHQKEVMESILSNVPTSQLAEGYKRFIGRVLKENNTLESKEKEDIVLAEGDSNKTDVDKEVVTEGVQLKGDAPKTLEETVDLDSDVKHLDESAQAALRKLAGIS